MNTTTSSFDYCNNRINRAMAERYPHDFSLCDIDGVSRYNYRSSNTRQVRMVIFESKHTRELLTNTQLETLTFISASMRWEMFDNKSGVFVISYDKENDIDVYAVYDNTTQYYCNYSSMDKLYQWFSGKDINN